jgi:restriction system protein
MGKNVWMVRSHGGSLAEEFVEQNYVGVDFVPQLDLSGCTTRASVEAKLRSFPDECSVSDIGNMARLVIDIEVGDHVVTYDKSRRLYDVGEVVTKYRYEARSKNRHQRGVKWLGEVKRDDVSENSRRSLGSTLTVFRTADYCASELLARLSGKVPEVSTPTATFQSPEPESLVLNYASVSEQAREGTKDVVAKLSWGNMQHLMAGVLRAMGYKTRVSPSGPDRGKDIVASPDGLLLQDPRIIVEVKHRSDQIGAPLVRSFIAGLRDSDRGLFLSTGGFSKEAYYEAERATVPVTLLDLDDMVELLVEHYDNVDAATRTLVPLSPVYWPMSLS